MTEMKPDNVKLQINIAGEKILLTVPSAQQEAVRQTESSVQRLYSQWRKDFPAKTEKELLAMMAYQYASFYRQLLHGVSDARQLAADAEARIDSILARPIDAPAATAADNTAEEDDFPALLNFPD